MREFETPPPQRPEPPRQRPEPPTPEAPAAPAATAAPPHSPLSWVSDVVDAAPLVLVVVLVIAVLRRRRWRRLVGRTVLSLVVASVVAGGAFYATYLAGCRAMRCVDAAGLVPILAGLGVGFVAGVVALVVVWRLGGSRSPGM